MAERAAPNPGGQTGGTGLRRILDRFRRPSGVPASTDDLAGELAPLFTLLDGIESEAHEIRATAERRIRAERVDASEEVEAILTEATHQAESERGEAAKAARRAVAAQSHALVEEGEAEAARVRETGRSHIPSLTAEVVRSIESLPERSP